MMIPKVQHMGSGFALEEKFGGLRSSTVSGDFNIGVKPNIHLCYSGSRFSGSGFVCFFVFFLLFEKGTHEVVASVFIYSTTICFR